MVKKIKKVVRLAKSEILEDNTLRIVVVFEGSYEDISVVLPPSIMASVAGDQGVSSWDELRDHVGGEGL